MNTNRKIAVIVGILFIVGTVSGILAGVFTAPIARGATYPLIGVGAGVLLVPTAIQEMVFAIWMIVKGFNQDAVRKLDEAQKRRLILPGIFAFPKPPV